ncbi:hypothetical protein [Leptospira meyeri]|uniref:hypothetical protein n=1 Tax=Leptospira meyeri TaxID=29508 RepID=UPI0002BE4ACA|nr:hypothetical protein [Leptospira meyeri]EMJ90284.1 hypothetical protein LEP1GSC196_0198 [Leptospira meyeri serovar Semaranga str. Veldrot Semarang 173]
MVIFCPLDDDLMVQFYLFSRFSVAYAWISSNAVFFSGDTIGNGLLNISAEIAYALLYLLLIVLRMKFYLVLNVGFDSIFIPPWNPYLDFMKSSNRRTSFCIFPIFTEKNAKSVKLIQIFKSYLIAPDRV